MHIVIVSEKVSKHGLTSHLKQTGHFKDQTINCKTRLTTKIFYTSNVKDEGRWRRALISQDGVAPSWTVCLPLLIFPCTIKSRSSLWHRLTRVVPEKGPYNGCVHECVM